MTTPLSYPPEAILTPEQLAAWLQCGVDAVKAANLPGFQVGNKWRYVAGAVLEELRRRQEGGVRRIA